MTPRVAVVHPGLVAGGGSEACALGMIRALQDDHRVTLITMGRPDLEALNAKYGAGVDLAKLETRSLSIPPGLRKRFDALRGFRLARYCRRHAGDFEAMISAYNVMDFGEPGIQRVADLSFDDGLRREFDFAGGAEESASHRASPWRSLYLGLARTLAGDRRGRWMRNRTIANSNWTAGLLRDRFGLASEVVYPPVAGGFPPVPWEEREEGFVVIGRLVPEKGIGAVVSILAEVRKERPVHLHIVGRPGPGAYAREVEALGRRHADWVRLEGGMYGADKAAFLSRHKYGISGRRAEPFGIAVAELVKAGCLVWAPDGGGQTEILAHPELVYAGPDDAAAKIRGVLADPARQAHLRDHLRARAGLFSAERFGREIRAIVEDFLEKKSAGAA